MNPIEQFLYKVSYKFPKGYPDINDEQDMLMLEGMLKEIGINLKEAKWDNEALAIKQLAQKFPDKYEIMGAKNRIANSKKVSPQEFTNDIKSTFNVDVKKMYPPKVSPNPSGKFNLFVFDIPIEGETVEVGVILAGGASANKGIEFENQVANDLQTYKDGGDQFVYKDLTESIVSEFGLTPTNFKIIPEGKKNQKRSLVFTPNGPLISTPGGQSVAETLTDITLLKEGKPIYISLKFGDSLTLFNSGAKTIFPEKEILSGKITNPNGVALLEMLGIDNEIFCRVFNEYEEDKTGTNFKQFHQKTENPDQAKITRFMESGIGSGYYMLKGSQKGSYDFFLVDEAYSKAAAKLSSDIDIEYGGKGGVAKRVNAVFNTQKYRIEINIRSKSGGVAPTHIMADYKPL
jgi:hypothetical protein